jgi:hypothetical protein
VLRDATRVPVLHGYGPRFLHSIGQLYKGGPARGLFLQVTHAPARDLSIPESPWSFGDLEAAQARGDLEALDARGKPALRFHLLGDVDTGLATLREALTAAARALRVTGARKPAESGAANESTAERPRDGSATLRTNGG